MVFIDFLSFKYLGAILQKKLRTPLPGGSSLCEGMGAILQNDGKISKDVHERYKLSG